MAAVGMLLSISVCVLAVSGEESCDTPTRSAALLQSSVHRNCKSTEEPYVLSPAVFFGPGPMGRMPQHMGPPHMRPPMGPYPGMNHYPGHPGNFNLESDAGLQSRGESSYGSTYGGGGGVVEPTPCQNSSAWTPDYDFAGYCDTWGLAVKLTKDTCDVEGCRFSHSYCYCETKEGCTAVGATWHPYTCRKQWESLHSTQIEKIKEAAIDGTCEGKEGKYGQKVKDMVTWPAQQCCKDYPSTMCEHDVQPKNPCLHEADFLPDAYAWASCDLSEVKPTKEQCEAIPGCKEEWGWCNCKTKRACEILGGYFFGGTCAEDLKWWSPGDHKGVAEALEKQTCHGVKGSWDSDIKYRVDWVAQLLSFQKVPLRGVGPLRLWSFKHVLRSQGRVFCPIIRFFWPQAPAPDVTPEKLQRSQHGV